jgi:hypothetical protein
MIITDAHGIGTELGLRPTLTLTCLTNHLPLLPPPERGGFWTDQVFSSNPCGCGATRLTTSLAVSSTAFPVTLTTGQRYILHRPRL